jgi:NAD/NADP transhydrogenase alpha subunit
LRDAYGNGANTPYTDPGCNLAATTNVFGRLVDGVDKKSVCKLSAKHISGHFIHIEQKKKERNDWNGWTKAVKQAFDLKNTRLGCSLKNKTKC